MSGSRRASFVSVLLLTLSFAAYGLWAIWRQSFVAIDGERYFAFADDALITLRYGWNLAHGHGLVWNPGERVEGITNLAWALWAAVLSPAIPSTISAIRSWRRSRPTWRGSSGDPRT